VKEGIVPGQLTVHADRGQVMRSKTVSQLLADLGVERSHSPPDRVWINRPSEVPAPDATSGPEEVLH